MPRGSLQYGHGRPATDSSSYRQHLPEGEISIRAPPDFRDDEEAIGDLVLKLRQYLVEIIDAPFTFEQLKTTTFSSRVLPLITALSDNCHHPAIVAALLCCKAVFAGETDDRSLADARSYAAELVAWRFLTHLQESEVIDYLCYELPAISDVDDRRALGASILESELENDIDDSPNSSFSGLNTLELAVVCDAKKFLSQSIVQQCINGIWDGTIMFWQNLDPGTKKKAKLYNKRKADPYCRLRVPKYQRFFEAVFFGAILLLYYAVLTQRNAEQVTILEGSLYVMFLSFAYDEFAQYWDSTLEFYSADIWSWVDLFIILNFIISLICRWIGLLRKDIGIINISFDILSLEALLLLPRIFSMFSLMPFFGTLVPAFRQMTFDIIKFFILVIVLYLGFLTTFSLLARDTFTTSQMAWMLIEIFFGSSSVGFDSMRQISPLLGAPLMLIFITLTNILLITALISILSNSLTVVINNAREEYLFMFSTYVLESATSNRLTYFYPPLNLVALAVRPLRLFMSQPGLRSLRITLIKATHFPVVALIILYERWRIDVGAGSFHHDSSTPAPAPTRPSSRRHKKEYNNRAEQQRALIGAKFSAGSSRNGDLYHAEAAEPGNESMETTFDRVDPIRGAGNAPLTVEDLGNRINYLQDDLIRRMNRLESLINLDTTSGLKQGSRDSSYK